ncbi:general L-amino acid transport system permease protein [Hoeflea marina]|uniref:General L-amino acid transport system permease protein n=1 Tax=Hoeflea marina TaxID=274592 RepID=A0A317PQC5_9HYPH|nr:ABC transporter permease subunit [Hoeflea marina]PWW03698.1 general L-amino acid transport system permease protein [Hoeflea marina]
MTTSGESLAGRLRLLLVTRKARQNALQWLVLAVVGLLIVLGLANLMGNLNAKGSQLGFGFLLGESGFDVNESMIPYSAGNSYLRALLVGTLNTLHLAIVCVVLSTVIGVFVGLLRLSEIRVFAIACRLYVETMRNLPKLLILLAVYVFLVINLPLARDAVTVLDMVYLSNRGVNLPGLRLDIAQALTLRGGVLFVAGAALGVGVWRWARARTPSRVFACYLPAACLAVGWGLLSGFIVLEMPQFKGFNFTGGNLVSLPFLSLVISLSVYHGAQVAEVVRGGIQAVERGQVEAGKALGLTGGQISWLIVLPQALRVMIPPMTNQYVNILKNTSIGLAVGYSDLVSIMNTTINQTFRPVELMLVAMSVYLLIGVGASIGLNAFNRRMQLKVR